MIKPRNTLKKTERLCAVKQIEILFKEGRSFFVYPLRIRFRVFPNDEEKGKHGVSGQMFVSVPKKRIRRAHNRNRIKRLIRESYRLQKQLLLPLVREGNVIHIAFIWQSEEVPDYAQVSFKVLEAIKIMCAKLKTEK